MCVPAGHHGSRVAAVRAGAAGWGEHKAIISPDAFLRCTRAVVSLMSLSSRSEVLAYSASSSGSPVPAVARVRVPGGIAASCTACMCLTQGQCRQPVSTPGCGTTSVVRAGARAGRHVVCQKKLSQALMFMCRGRRSMPLYQGTTAGPRASQQAAPDTLRSTPHAAGSLHFLREGQQQRLRCNQTRQ